MPPQMQQQNGIIRRYIVNLTSIAGGRQLITYSQATTTLVHNLHPFTNYTCSVSAETVAPGPFSPAVIVQTLEDGKVFVGLLRSIIYSYQNCKLSNLKYSAAPTAPPEDLLATALDSRTLHISWQPPAEEDRNGIIRRYVTNITELNTGTDFELESTNTEITLQNLHPFYQYSCSVAAETVALGPSTPVVTIEMPEDGNLLDQLSYFVKMFKY